MFGHSQREKVSQLGLIGGEQGLKLLAQHDVPSNLQLALEESLQEMDG